MLLACFALAVVRPAFGQARFEAPPGCGSELEYQAELARLLGASSARTAPARLLISGPDPQGEYTLRLALGGETRELKDRDCLTLLKSAAVIAVAAARDEAPPPVTPAPAAPERALPAPPPARTPFKRRRRAVIVAPAEEAAPAAARRTAAGGAATGYGVFVGAGISSGVVPDVGVTLLGGASLEPAPFGLALSLRYAPTRRTERGGRAVDIQSLGARLDGLYRIAPAVDLALGLEADRLLGTGGEAVSSPESNAAWRVGSSLGLSLIPWRDIQPRIELGVSGQLALLRPRFIVDGFGDLYRVPLLGADAIIRGLWLFR